MTPAIDPTEVARSIRGRHLLALVRAYRSLLREVRQTRRLRQRRAKLLHRVRLKKLGACLQRLRSPGFTLTEGADPPCFIYDPQLTPQHLRWQNQRREELRNEWTELKNESLEPIVANLTTLFEETRLEREAPLSVSWRVSDIELEEVWIGDLEVRLHLEEFAILAENLSVDTDTKGGFQHPHVSPKGEICWGDSYQAALAYHRSGDFLALKDLVNNLLRTYNSASPYITLEDWAEGVGEACVECGDRRARDDLSFSETSQGYLCGACSYYCDHCHDTVVEREYDVRLEGCKACVEEKVKPCALCRQRFWPEELRLTLVRCDGERKRRLCCGECRKIVLHQRKEEAA